MLELKSKTKSYGINFPTSINEFTPELLASITDNIQLPKFYSIIALCYNVKLFDFMATIRNNKPGNTPVTPLLARADKEELKLINGSIGDRVVISKSSMEMGQHLNIPVMITTLNASNYFKLDEDAVTTYVNKKPQIGDSLIKAIQLDSELNAKSIYVMEFKIIPIRDIVATIPLDSKIIDPFKTISLEKVN